MTEDEAKTKWCPFARLLQHTYSQDGQGRSFEGGYSYNRSPDPDEVAAPYMPHGSFCIASACMAWRWTAKPVEGRPIGRYHAAIERVIGDGFCGLAGSPS